MRVTQDQVNELNKEVGHAVYGLSKVGSNLAANALTPEYIALHGLKDMFNGPSLSSKAWELAKTRLNRTYYRYEQNTDLETNLEKKIATYCPAGFFTSAEEALDDYSAAHRQAAAKLNHMALELEKLQASIGAYVGFNVDCDTYGIYNDYLYIGCKIGQYYFRMKIAE